MKTLTAWLSCLILLMAAGCGKAPRPSSQIEVWHWMTDRQEAFEALAQQYEQKSGIKVNFELFAPSDTYTKKITAASQANVLPDIYGVLDKKYFLSLFIKAGYVADLSQDFAADNGAWEKSLLPETVNVNRFKPGNADQVTPGIYGVPIDATNIQMLYNIKLLKKAGVKKVPATFDEFLAAAVALKRVGIAPFVSGFGEIWMVESFAMNYAFNILGEEKVMATFRGDVKYSDPEWIKVFQIFKTLASKGAFIAGIVTKGNKYAEQDFANERAAFAFNGSWCVNVYRAMNPDLEYGVSPLPKFSAARPIPSWGGAGSSFIVNNSSSNKVQAIEFLKWLTAKEQQVFLLQNTHNLPANKEAMNDVPPILMDFAGSMEDATHPSVWDLNEDPVVSEAFARSIQSIIIGEKTPVQAARDVQAVKERQTQKLSR